MYHCATGSNNPILINRFRDLMMEYAKIQPYLKKLAPVYAFNIDSDFLFDLLYTMTEKIPLKIFDKVSKMPMIGSEKM